MGKITAHDVPRICHPRGMRSVDSTIIATQTTTDVTSASQNRLRIFGTSSQKFDFSTSFFVAPHVMLYENRCAKMA